MSYTPLHVVIIGGGIGGLCLAQGLKTAGVSFAVYERNSSTNWLEGYRIQINPIGSRALHACLPPALWETFLATAGISPAGLGFLTEQLQELIVIADQFMSNKNSNPIDAYYPVSRLALRQVLLAGLESVVHFEKDFERYEYTSGGRVTAYFADGTSATGDVLVAADGANSRIRQQYLPQAPRRDIGAAGIGGKVLLTEQTKAWLPHQLGERLNLIMPPDRYCLFTAPIKRKPLSSAAQSLAREQAKEASLNPDLLFDAAQDYLLWALIASSSEYPDDMPQLPEQDLLRVANQMMASWHPQLRRLVAASAPKTVSFISFKASTVIGPWESTNVTLLGDAIHNMPPVGGLGGNMALYDAWRLSRALTDVQQGRSVLLAAIADYEAELRAHGFASVRAALKYTQQVITNKRLQRLGSRIWFRSCRALPPLKHVFEDRWTRPMHNQLQETATREPLHA
jgi:2-polyprenyl-6-methoxyphenol hydroxylase-like FAD-dependent oxidoreductase